VLAAACSPAGHPTLVVGAAASLSEAVAALGDAYDGADLELSLSGSQVLVAQVREGAPLDVVLTADRETAAALTALGVVAGEPVRFAGNRLAIAVPEGNPRAISGLADLADEALTIVLAGPEVPAGRYTRLLLERAGLTVRVSSYEPSVRGVLTKVQLGEADAGIVYRTDLAAGRVTGVEIDPAINPETAYYAAALASSDRPEAAAAFIAFLLSEDAAVILSAMGFEP
jgi:molybdate transport system substrate-binding protein